MKTLVVYYSLSGKTETIAKVVAAELGGEVLRIEEVKQRKGFAATYLDGGRAAGKDECSEIKPCNYDVTGYDLIFIGTPDWNNKPAPAVNTFIEKTDFTNKPVVLFATYGGRPGIDSLFRNFTDKVTVKSGRVAGTFFLRSFGLKESDMVVKTKDELKRVMEQVNSATPAENDLVRIPR